MVWFAIAQAMAGSCGCYASRAPSAAEQPVDLTSTRPEVLLARLCAFIPDQALCNDTTEAVSFKQLLATLRMISPTPLFADSAEFVDFVQGKGPLYSMVLAFLGSQDPLLSWTPVTIPDDLRDEVTAAFATTGG